MRLQSSRDALAASSSEKLVDDNANIPVPAPPAPLRPPRTGPTTNGHKPSADKPRVQHNQYNNNKARFVPAGHQTVPQRLPRGAPRDHGNDNVDDDFGGPGPSDKKTFQKNQSGALNSPNRKPNLDASKPMFESKKKVEDAGAKVETAQAKAETAPAKTETAPAKAETAPAKAETAPVKVDSPSPKLNIRKTPSLAPENKKEVKSSPQATLVPAQYLVEKLPIGESFVVSVERACGACASKQRGFVCLALHAQYEPLYNDLLADIYQGEERIVPTPGATFAYLEPSEQGWYRARCLSATRCALIDGSRLADITAQSECRALAPKYATIPEFCCVLDGNVQVNMSLKCTILMKTAEGYKVSIDDSSEDSYLGEGLITRWIPEVETLPPSKPASVQDRLTQGRVEIPPTIEVKPEKKSQAMPEKNAQPMPESKLQAMPEKKPTSVPEKKPIVTPDKMPLVPEIPRPDIVNNGRYILLHVTSLTRACVRACDDETTAEFESVLQDTAFYGMQSAKKLSSSPTKGDVVLCHYEGVHYRALVTRTKASDNRYMVQYAEYGNEEIVSLEKLFTCPPELHLAARPARASLVALSTTQGQLTEPATEYVDSLKEQVELVATIPSGEKTAPSGSLVVFCIAKNKENINKKVEAMCTPEWKKLEQAVGDVIESEVILFSSMKTLPLPTDREFVLEVTDFTYLERGIVCGFEQGIALPAQVYGPLTDKINEYCNSALCAEPYLPMVEELCLARLEPYPQWFRAVVVSHKPGAATATVLYIDYGNISASVPVADLRKCMPEFAALPALAASAEIVDFPATLTAEQLLRAVEFLQIDEEGRGRLPVTSCRLVPDDMTYTVHVPALIAAINK